MFPNKPSQNPERLDEIWSKLQRALCQQYKADFVACDPQLKVGISQDTATDNIPINGLRHPPVGDTTGWYLWSGEVLSDAPDFFQPMHAIHLLERCPEVARFLGLPPGYRFLIAGDYLDVWYDESLLNE